MSVSNPERIVTKQDLADFYDELLPFISPKSYAGFTPIGTIIPMIAEDAPANYLKCNGATYNKSDYPELAAHLLSMTSHSMYEVSGDDTKFKVPDLRGEFLRGTGTNSHETSGNGSNVGVHQGATQIPYFYSYQNGTISQFAGRTSSDADGQYNTPSGADSTRSGTSQAKYTFYQGTTQSATSDKIYSYGTRPTNTSVLFCIATKNIYLDPKNDYSTEEKVIGTWIDGKTIYQKTIVTTTPTVTTDGTYVTKNIPLDISNIGSIKFIEDAFVIDGDNLSRKLPYLMNSGVQTKASLASTYIQLISGSVSMSEKPCYITIQYTKTT